MATPDRRPDRQAPRPATRDAQVRQLQSQPGDGMPGTTYGRRPTDRFFAPDHLAATATHHARRLLRRPQSSPVADDEIFPDSRTAESADRWVQGNRSPSFRT